MDQPLELERRLAKPLVPIQLFRRTSCNQSILAIRKNRRLRNRSYSSCVRKSLQANRSVSWRHIRCRRMVLHCKDRKQRFLRRNLARQLLNRMARQVQLRNLVQLDRYSLMHMLICKRACSSDC